jgi:hypothetical protein
VFPPPRLESPPVFVPPPVDATGPLPWVPGVAAVPPLPEAAPVFAPPVTGVIAPLVGEIVPLVGEIVSLEVDIVPSPPLVPSGLQARTKNARAVVGRCIAFPFDLPSDPCERVSEAS